ncbi:DNA-directed RNA polymerase II subunit GRINL1A [Bagarius yarrelli]|uniref:DNA-directed RNA polymerase II subunit GRINL1A n=1 Tax=Bagarius yarrelli TaxID=175774 RepID=A0A556TLI8_BAGYA|nr:DNA-directed RNA polymerase II subunit GRINL1A [Bagarius yarrelli]
MERQELLGDLKSKSKEQLCEILTRQEKLLNNERFVQTLPDRGKKIFEFVEKVRHALANKEEEEKKQSSLASARSEFQARYQQAFTQRQHVIFTDPLAAKTGFKQNTVNTETLHLVDATSRADGENCSDSHCLENVNVRETTSGDTTAAGKEDRDTDTDLMVAFERVTLSEENSGPSRDTARNPFSGSQQQQQQKPHYIEVLEKSAKNVRKPRLKLNQLPVKSASSSPGQSPGIVTPLSAEARRQRDRKHLDDITAAKLPPLHHSPAQLLSLAESVTLLQEQTKTYQELQAKLAAQKLTEGLTVGINSYHPEGGALAAYREVHDDGTLSEED